MVEANNNNNNEQNLLEFKNSILHSDMRIEDNWRGNSDQIKRGINYTKVQPTPLEDPYVALLSQDCMDLIGLDHRK